MNLFPSILSRRALRGEREIERIPEKSPRNLQRKKRRRRQMKNIEKKRQQDKC